VEAVVVHSHGRILRPATDTRGGAIPRSRPTLGRDDPR
jgi:hypothetical protein